MHYRIMTASLIVIVIMTVFQISLISATSIGEWKTDYDAWSQVEDAEGQKQNTVEQVLQASTATVQPVTPNASNDAKKKHSIFLPFLSRGTTSHPANPNASEDARKVLSYIGSLPDRPDKRVISGQHLSYHIAKWEVRDWDPGWGCGAKGGMNAYVEELARQTGKYVAMIGTTYGLGATPEEIHQANIEVLIPYWNNSGLITIDHHANNPWTGGNSWDLTSRDLTELITPGTVVNTVWMAELDKVAAGLAELRVAGVVVLWRPFHEMNFRECFWWDMGAVLNDHPEQGLG